MMKPTVCSTICCVVLATGLSAQDLAISSSASTELTKTSRDARYGGTFIQGDQARVLFVSSTKADGVQVEEYALSIGAGTAAVQDQFIGCRGSRRSNCRGSCRSPRWRPCPTEAANG